MASRARRELGRQANLHAHLAQVTHSVATTPALATAPGEQARSAARADGPADLLRCLQQRRSLS